MEKTINFIFLFALSLCSPVFADALKVMPDEKMLERFPVVFEGVVKSIEREKREWGEIEGEKFIKFERFRALMKISKTINGGPISRDEIWIFYNVPGPSYGRYSKLFNKITVGENYRVYADKVITAEKNEYKSINLHSEGQIRRGTVLDRVSQTAINEKLRADAVKNAKTEIQKKDSKKGKSEKRKSLSGKLENEKTKTGLTRNKSIDTQEKLLDQPQRITVGVLLIGAIALLLFKVLKIKSSS